MQIRPRAINGTTGSQLVYCFPYNIPSPSPPHPLRKSSSLLHSKSPSLVWVNSLPTATMATSWVHHREVTAARIKTIKTKIYINISFPFRLIKDWTRESLLREVKMESQRTGRSAEGQRGIQTNEQNNQARRTESPPPPLPPPWSSKMNASQF